MSALCCHHVPTHGHFLRAPGDLPSRAEGWSCASATTRGELGKQVTTHWEGALVLTGETEAQPVSVLPRSCPGNAMPTGWLLRDSCARPAQQWAPSHKSTNGLLLQHDGPGKILRAVGTVYGPQTHTHPAPLLGEVRDKCSVHSQGHLSSRPSGDTHRSWSRPRPAPPRPLELGSEPAAMTLP